MLKRSRIWGREPDARDLKAVGLTSLLPRPLRASTARRTASILRRPRLRVRAGFGRRAFADPEPLVEKGNVTFICMSREGRLEMSDKTNVEAAIIARSRR